MEAARFFERIKRIPLFKRAFCSLVQSRTLECIFAFMLIVNTITIKTSEQYYSNLIVSTPQCKQTFDKGFFPIAYCIELYYAIPVPQTHKRLLSSMFKRESHLQFVQRYLAHTMQGYLLEGYHNRSNEDVTQFNRYLRQILFCSTLLRYKENVCRFSNRITNVPFAN